MELRRLLDERAKICLVGATYASVTVIGADEAAVTAICDRPAFVASDHDVVVAFTEADDAGGEPTAGLLSHALSCRTLVVSVHDSDLLAFQVHVNGSLAVAGCVPDPAEFFGEDAGADSTPRSASPDDIVAALGQGSADQVRRCLHADYLFAEDRHRDLLEALGLPTWSVGFGYRYLAQGSSAYEGPTLTRLAATS